MNETAVIYIHGKGGNADEAEHYKPFFKNSEVIGFDYKSQNPWEAKEEFPRFFDSVSKKYCITELIAVSIGAYFALNALSGVKIERAYFISPVVDMEKLISDMMTWTNISEDELREKKEIPTAFGETLSWEYLCYVRENPVVWKIPSRILYGEKDNLQSYETIAEFARRTNASLTVMKGGEHWFYTESQMNFLDNWLKTSV